VFRLFFLDGHVNIDKNSCIATVVLKKASNTLYIQLFIKNVSFAGAKLR